MDVVDKINGEYGEGLQMGPARIKVEFRCKETRI